MDSQKTKIEETITDPDLIQRGDFGEFLAIRFYSATPLTQKHLIVVYKEISGQDGFVVTAYFAGLPSKRRQILWTR